MATKGPPAYTYTEAPRQPDYQSIYTGPGPYPPPAPQPQDGYYQQPPGYAPVPTYAPAPAYAPVPAAFPPQQQVTNNVVVVGQPTAPAPAHAPAATVVVPDRTVDHTVLTVVLMVLCFFHCNFPAFICLIPALIFAMNASMSKNAGNLEQARRYNCMALCCNIGSIVYYAVLVCYVIISVVVAVSS